MISWVSNRAWNVLFFPKLVNISLKVTLLLISFSANQKHYVAFAEQNLHTIHNSHQQEFIRQIAELSNRSETIQFWYEAPSAFSTISHNPHEAQQTFGIDTVWWSISEVTPTRESLK